MSCCDVSSEIIFYSPTTRLPVPISGTIILTSRLLAYFTCIFEKNRLKYCSGGSLIFLLSRSMAKFV